MTQPDSKSAVAAAYDEWAETYDTDHNRTRELASKVLREINLTFDGCEVIEVGCGTGYNTAWLAKSAASIMALDFSEGMLLRAQARVRDSRVRFIQHDVRTPWPLADASADLLIAMLVLEHVEILEPFFAEARRTLRTGGELFLCELHPIRQLMGKQAQFTDVKTGKLRRVPAYLHETHDYVSAAILSGFELVSRADWRDANSQVDITQSSEPRLLSLRFQL